MAITFVFDEARNSINWEGLLFFANGIFDQPRTLTANSGSGLATVTVQVGAVVLTFTSDLNDLVVAGSKLTGGTATSITLQSNGTTALHLTGLSVGYAEIQALLDAGAENGHDPLFLAVFASAATIFQTPASGPISAFGSAASDEFSRHQHPRRPLQGEPPRAAGEYTVHGSDGEDFVDYSASSQGLTIDFGSGTVVRADTTSLGTFDFEVEYVAGSDHADTFNGDGRHNAMFGNAGDDTLNGFDGDDYLNGGDDEFSPTAEQVPTSTRAAKAQTSSLAATRTATTSGTRSPTNVKAGGWGSRPRSRATARSRSSTPMATQTRAATSRR